MKLIYKFLITAAFLASLQSCKKDFLNRPPLDRVTDGNFYTSANEVLASTAPLYNIVWFDFNDKAALSIGDARAGNMISNDREMYYRFSVAATDLNNLLAAYKSFYKIIAQSNIAIENISKRAVNVSPDVKNYAIAEARFMRALAYYYLLMNWGEVPIIYDNRTQMADPTVRRNTKESVWQYIIRDLRFAAVNLTPVAPFQGRVTKYSAEGMLARMYLTRSGLTKAVGSRSQSDLDSAKFYAADVIKNSQYKLLPKYSDLFLSKNNNSSSNNSESLFALQWMPLTTPWGVNNSFQAYMAFTPDITGTGDGWGAAHGASSDLIKYYMAHPEEAERRKATVMFNDDIYPELLKSKGGLKYTSTSIANLKKYIIGSPEENGGLGASMAVNINTYMMRLPEVYLIYAEAILGNSASTSDAEALNYFNMVRKRAGVPEKNSITFMDILMEKRVETAMEGIFWYELMRWYYFDPTGVLDYISKQDKGSYTITHVAGTENPRQYTVTYTPAFYPASPQTIYLPWPESEILAAPNLKQEPVPFDFSKLSD